MGTKTQLLVIGGLSLLAASCRGANHSSVISPTPTAVAPAPTPAGDPTGLQPTIAGVTPNVVSTAGTWGTITGTQFQPDVTVRIGDAFVAAVFRDSTTIQFPRSGAHAEGPVDVTVTNPGGLAATLVRGYTYAAPSSFDANGDWLAHADARNDYVTEMRFTISGDRLTSLSCGTPATMPTALPMHDGVFSFTGAGGLAMTGTLTSTTTAHGQVSAPGCGDGIWWADKSRPSQF